MEKRLGVSLFDRTRRGYEPTLDGTPELWVLYRPDMRHVARVRLFVDFLVERLRADRDLFEGRGTGEGSVASSTTGRRGQVP